MMKCDDNGVGGSEHKAFASISFYALQIDTGTVYIGITKSDPLIHSQTDSAGPIPN